jgi:hypothetical protein
VKNKHEKSREEQLATEVLELVERFHAPSSHRHDEPRRTMRLAVPAAFEALALLTLAQQLRARRRNHDRRHVAADRLRSGMRRAFVLRHL